MNEYVSTAVVLSNKTKAAAQGSTGVTDGSEIPPHFSPVKKKEKEQKKKNEKVFASMNWSLK